MTRKLLIALAPGFTAACTSPDDIRQRPAIWTASYSASYDDMANCVAAGSIALLISATPLINRRAKHAEVLLYNSVYGNMMGQYDFRETGPGLTDVSYRSVVRSSRLSPNNGVNDLLNSCAKAA